MVLPDEGQVAIFDATNTTEERRRFLVINWKAQEWNMVHFSLASFLFSANALSMYCRDSKAMQDRFKQMQYSCR